MDSRMSDGRRMLLESLTGHLELLKAAYPQKAATNCAKKTQRYVTQSLRISTPRKRAA